MSYLARPLATYASTIGMAVQSHRYQTFMTAHVDQMTVYAAQGAMLQESAATHAAQSEAEEDSAVTDQADSAALHEEAAALKVRAEELEADAAGDQEEVSILEAKAGGEQGAADEAAARAAADEAIADDNEGVAADVGAKAAAEEAAELNDGMAVAVCEFIPLLDIVCDGLGAVAGISLQGEVATDLAEAVAATGAAVAARNDEKVQAAQTAEMEIASAADEEAAAGLETQAEAEEAEAIADQQEAEIDETSAETLQAQGEASEAASGADTAEADEQEMQAGSAFEKAGQHGLEAALSAVWSVAIGVVAVAYFGVKIFARALTGATSLVVTTLLSTQTPTKFLGFLPHNVSLDMSYYFLHSVIFFSTLIFMLQHLMELQSLDGAAAYSLRSQGGWTLIFACGAATFQLLVLHAFPDALRGSYSLWSWTKLYIFLVSVFAMEALITIVNLRWATGAREVALKLCHVPMWVVLIALSLCVALHYLLLRDQYERPLNENPNEARDEESRLDESTLLIVKEQSHERPGLRRHYGHRVSWEHLLIPLELLVLSCLIVILASCSAHAQVLWPILHKWMTGHARVIPVFLVIYLIVVVACTLLLIRPSQRQQPASKP